MRRARRRCGTLSVSAGGQDVLDVDALGGIVAGVAGGAEGAGGAAVDGFAGSARVGEADE